MMLLNRFINCLKISSFIFVLLVVGLCSCSVYWTEGGKPNTVRNPKGSGISPNIDPEDARELDQIFNSLDLNQNTDVYSAEDDLLLTSFKNDISEDNVTIEDTNTNANTSTDTNTDIVQTNNDLVTTQNVGFELNNHKDVNNPNVQDDIQPENLADNNPGTDNNDKNQGVTTPSSDSNFDFGPHSNPNHPSVSEKEDRKKYGSILASYLESLKNTIISRKKGSSTPTDTDNSTDNATTPTDTDNTSTLTNVPTSTNNDTKDNNNGIPLSNDSDKDTSTSTVPQVSTQKPEATTNNSNIIVDTKTSTQITTYSPRPQPVPQRQPKNIEVTDQHVCASLRYLEKNAHLLPNFSSTNLENFQRAVRYFCNNNAENLRLLRVNSYNGTGAQKDIFVDTVFELQGKDGSYLATATASTENSAKLEVFPYISSSYCEGFDIYKSRYGEENVKEIDFIKILDIRRITNEIFKSKWCSFHLKSKPMFFILVPEYKGILIHNMFLDNRLFIELNYTTEPISLVKDLLAISIAYTRSDGSLSSYAYRYMASIKTSFHSTLVKSTIDKAKDIAKKRFEVNKRLSAIFSN